MAGSQLLQLNGHSYQLERNVIAAPELDPLLWLKEQNLYPKVYWQDRENKHRFAAAGCVLHLDQPPSFDSDAPQDVRFFGAMGFSHHKKDNTWNLFPKQMFFLPSVELHRSEEKSELTVNAIGNNGPLFSFSHASAENQKKNLLSRFDSPVFEQWEQHLLECLEMIKSGKIEKIVLARRSTFQFDQRICPLDLLYHLRKSSENATVFAFQFSKEHAFIGASPEKLYERQGKQIISEAIAGTRPRGKTSKEDLFFKSDLINSSKENHEFSVVKSFIYEKLSPMCESCSYEESDSILKTSTVQHIYNRCTGRLKDSISDLDLMKTLHPSPAIGGNPSCKAFQFIESKEPFDRGWYASPLGWVSPEAADIAVGIRSALVENSQLHLFAGTGIVRGSEPIKEWEELEHKIAQFRAII
ncbi:MAG TPA: isochorismate synthase [Rhabdochlamydiaceae bacterium]|nr:isochorismate synthase [Rhabdochlamydiaceae bacterium]